MGEKHKANFLWPHNDESIEALGYEFANAKTEEYREEMWKGIMSEIESLRKRVKELEEEVKAYRDFDKFQEPEWVKENESLRKRVKELEAELKERQEAFDRASCCVVEERLVNERLEKKLEIARDALEDYASCSDGCTCGDGWSHDSAKEALAAIDNNNCACGGYMEVIYGGKGRRCNKCGKESKEELRFCNPGAALKAERDKP